MSGKHMGSTAGKPAETYFGVPWEELEDYEVPSERHEQMATGACVIYMDGEPVMPFAFTEGEIANMLDLSYRTLFDREAAAEQARREKEGHPVIPIHYLPNANSQ